MEISQFSGELLIFNFSFGLSFSCRLLLWCLSVGDAYTLWLFLVCGFVWRNCQGSWSLHPSWDRIWVFLESSIASYKPARYCARHLFKTHINLQLWCCRKNSEQLATKLPNHFGSNYCVEDKFSLANLWSILAWRYLLEKICHSSGCSNQRRHWQMRVSVLVRTLQPVCRSDPNQALMTTQNWFQLDFSTLAITFALGFLQAAKLSMVWIAKSNTTNMQIHSKEIQKEKCVDKVICSIRALIATTSKHWSRKYMLLCYGFKTKEESITRLVYAWTFMWHH